MVVKWERIREDSGYKTRTSAEDRWNGESSCLSQALMVDVWRVRGVRDILRDLSLRLATL